MSEKIIAACGAAADGKQKNAGKLLQFRQVLPVLRQFFCFSEMVFCFSEMAFFREKRDGSGKVLLGSVRQPAFPTL